MKYNIMEGMQRTLLTVTIVLICTGCSFAMQADDGSDFAAAQIVAVGNLSTHEQAAITLLVEEVEKRTLVAFPVVSELPAASVPCIVVGTAASFKEVDTMGDLLAGIPVQNEAEGYTVKLMREAGKAPTLLIVGNDSRGMLFGIGHFLRKVSMGWNTILVPDYIDITTHPSSQLRGHQLGYRPKTNAYDGMDEHHWEQYIRDLIVFGTNAIEIMPPFTDDARTSPMFPRPQLDMMKRMDAILEKYDIAAWIWFPLMHGDYAKAENERQSLKEAEEIFRSLSRIDAIFVPGGDPGHTHPDILFPYLEKQTELLHKYHPGAEVWVSPQGFNQERMNVFFQLLKTKPKWLTGVVYAPQMPMDINGFAKIVGTDYPIRRYPDITHSFDSQYPVANWDFAFAATQNREGINPRPKAQTAIFRVADPKKNVGFITYSEGLNDDVNKIVWSGLGWNRDADVNDILADYSRYFIGKDYAHDFAQGLYNLEKNWDGSLIDNRLVNVHHSMFQQMERNAPPQVRLNWRFQLALYRSYYDAYNRSRLLYETELEAQAYDALRKAPVSGSLNAIEEARSILREGRTNLVAEDIRARVYELAEALFQSTRMQLSTSKYFAIATRRGANLDLIDYPLNNGIWLEDQFQNITRRDDERDRLKALDSIINWTNPGPGGYYDDLGDVTNQPHIDLGEAYDKDPAFYHTPFVGFSAYERTKNWRVSWARYMQTLHGYPLKMRYDELDATAQYVVKVTYVGNHIRLQADGDIVIHDYFDRGAEMVPVTFDVPRKATQDGKLILEWNMEPGQGSTGRGCQIAEVWLMKKQEADKPTQRIN